MLTLCARRSTVRLRHKSSQPSRKRPYALCLADGLVYPAVSQFYDKNSLSYSSIMGLPLAKHNTQYSLVASAFYIVSPPPTQRELGALPLTRRRRAQGFMIFEIPSSTLAQRFPLAKYLGVNIVLWAVFLTLHSASASFGVFFAMRFMLGVFECCVSPSECSVLRPCTRWASWTDPSPPQS